MKSNSAWKIFQMLILTLKNVAFQIASTWDEVKPHSTPFKKVMDTFIWLVRSFSPKPSDILCYVSISNSNHFIMSLRMSILWNNMPCKDIKWYNNYLRGSVEKSAIWFPSKLTLNLLKTINVFVIKGAYVSFTNLPNTARQKSQPTLL